MRPRHILLLLAAIPIGLAVVLAGGGGASKVPGVPAADITLALVGATRGSAALACGATHNYTTYPAGGTIRFRGTISTAGTWSVKVKLKACQANAFQSSGEASATLPSKTSYAGSFPAPIAGYYFARADLKQNGALVGHSEKAYFEVR
jgi:hypothetical protein